MSLVPTIYLQSPISSELVNNRFKRIIPAGPKEGFHLSQKAPGSWVYEVKNTRNASLGNSLVTRGGVVIQETANIVDEVTVSAGGTFLMTVEFDQAAGDLVGTVNCFDQTSRAVRATETLFAVTYVPPGATEALDDYIVAIPREDFTEDANGIQSRLFTADQIGGSVPVEKSMSLHPLLALNCTAKTVPSNFGPALPNAAMTTMVMNPALPLEFSEEAWSKDTTKVYLRIWVQMLAASTPSNVALIWTLQKITDGTPDAEVTSPVVHTLSHLGSGDQNMLQFDAGSLWNFAGRTMEVEDNYILTVTRDGGYGSDTCTADLLIVAATWYYPASGIGRAY